MFLAGAWVVHTIAAIPPTIAAIAALITALRNGKNMREKMAEIHVILNSRLTQLLEETKIASHAEGRQAERDALSPPTATPPTV